MVPNLFVCLVRPVYHHAVARSVLGYMRKQTRCLPFFNEKKEPPAPVECLKYAKPPCSPPRLGEEVEEEKSQVLSAYNAIGLNEGMRMNENRHQIFTQPSRSPY